MLVAFVIVMLLAFAGGIGTDACVATAVGNALANGVAVVCSVSKDMLGLQTLQQRLGLRGVATLTGREDQAAQATLTVN